MFGDFDADNGAQGDVGHGGGFVEFTHWIVSLASCG